MSQDRPSRAHALTRRALPVLGVLLLSSCASSHSAGDLTRARYLMGTTCEVSLPAAPSAAADAEAAFAEIDRIESLLSTWRPESELSRANHAAPGVPFSLSPELFDVLSRVMGWTGSTDGAFNPLVRPLIDLWKTRAEGAVPEPAAIDAALEMTAPSGIEIASGALVRRRSSAIEEGAFGKGYAIDRALEVLRSRGAGRAAIDFGGQLAAFGYPGGVEVAVAHPERRDRPAVTVTMPAGSLSTSSGSERTFEVGGERFTHIIDPRTGRALPPRGSVTVYSTSALEADVLSTALFVLGPSHGPAWADAHGVAALFLVPSGEGRYELRISRAFAGIPVEIADNTVIK